MSDLGDFVRTEKISAYGDSPYGDFCVRGFLRREDFSVRGFLRTGIISPYGDFLRTDFCVRGFLRTGICVGRISPYGDFCVRKSQ